MIDRGLFVEIEAGFSAGARGLEFDLFLLEEVVHSVEEENSRLYNLYLKFKDLKFTFTMYYFILGFNSFTCLPYSPFSMDENV